MPQIRNIPGPRRERGIVILLVAFALLFVVGGMAALSIDVVTFYTARSEAQLAADSAALAGARALANSGMTSDPNASSDGLMANAETLATTIANEVAMRNVVGGRTLFPGNGEVSVSFNDTDPSFETNPRITVQTQRTDLPTFFARIWGRAVVTVRASATAEVYNPSKVHALGGIPTPVAPSCVKPWVLPNMSPKDLSGATPIINRTTGAIVDTTLLGVDLSGTALLQARCAPGTCGGSWWNTATPKPWQYYPGDPSSFPEPTTMLPACASGFTASLQNSIAGCVQTPISCGDLVDLEKVHGNLRTETAEAVNCLIHASTTSTTADMVDPASGPIGGPDQPFQFLAGADNPLVLAGHIPANNDVMVSNSIVTVPIYDDGNLSAVPPPVPVTPVPIVGFVQVFISPTGIAVPSDTGDPNLGAMNVMIINITGCGTGATGQPILGNGGSPVPVRLITP